MLKVIMLAMVLILPVTAVQFPVAPLGLCYDGCEKLIRENAYPGATIAYNSSINHVWLLHDGKVIDTYFGEMTIKQSGYVPEKVFDTWEEFDSSLPRIDVTGL
jgi:hypothetical protein